MVFGADDLAVETMSTPNNLAFQIRRQLEDEINAGQLLGDILNKAIAK